MKRLLLAAVGLLAAAPAAAQTTAQPAARTRPPAAPVLTIIEVDDDGHEHTVARQGSVVDINSTIRVELNAARLRERAGQVVGADTALASRIQLMRQLQEVADAGLTALPGAARALTAWSRDLNDATAAAGFGAAIAPVLGALQTLQRLAPAGSPLRVQLDEAASPRVSQPGTSTLVIAASVLQAAADEAERLRAEVDAVLQSQGTYVQLGGWLLTGGTSRPIHMEGFDTLPQGEYYAVQRYTYVLTPEQQAELQDLQTRAADLRARGAGVGEVLRTELRSTIGDLPAAVDACVAGLRSEISGVQTAVPALRARLQPALDLVERHVALLQVLRAQFGPGAPAATDPATFLTNLNAQITALASLTAETPTVLADLRTAITNEAGAAAVALRTRLGTCETQLTGSLSGVLSAARTLAQMWRSTQQVSTASLAFSEQVLRRDISTVTEGTRFSLKNTGSREEGDAVVIRLAVGARNRPAATVEEHQFQVDRVIPYVYTATSLVFAAPFQLEDTQVSRRFQPAASYSILYSRGSRRSTAYNQLLRFSIGINAALLDFDKDDTPELGLGVVVSGLANLLQGGVGRNIQGDESYWFFGVRLPTGSMMLGTP